MEEMIKNEVRIEDIDNEKKNPYAEMTERPEHYNGPIDVKSTYVYDEADHKTKEVVMDKNEKVESEEKITVVEPDCTYWECCTNDFCDKCSRKCNGVIKAKGHKAQIMDQNKMCLKLGGDPDVYYVTKGEAEAILNGNKVAYLEVKIDPRNIKDNSLTKIFFGIREE
jgi:hypothetical protein